MINKYYAEINKLLSKIIETQITQIEEASKIISNSIKNAGIVHIFGCGHSHIIAEEIFSRAGGLAPINPILEPSLMLHESTIKSGMLERLSGYGSTLFKLLKISQNDCMIIVSNSGRNTVPIEMAAEAKNCGLKTIAITSLEHSQQVVSRHLSGKKLYEICDIVIDNCGRIGDASIEVELPLSLDSTIQHGKTNKSSKKIFAGATSTITGVFIVNSLCLKAIENLIIEGIIPPVFISANIDNSEVHNFDMIQKYKNRIRF